MRPVEGYLRIAGRYVLTPEILQVLQNEGSQEKSRYDLTSAINHLWRASASVLALKLSHPMLSIAPYRTIIQAMDTRKLFDAKWYESREADQGKRRRGVFKARKVEPNAQPGR